MATFEIELDVFRGPLDLLVYLVRRHEVTPDEIPLATIASQFLDAIEALDRPDFAAAGEFLDLTTTLLEIKARAALPQDDDDAGDEPVPDIREELVTRLLEYRQFRDAATILTERSARWQDRVARQAPEPTDARIDPKDQPIGELELWDLVSAHGRLVREQRQAGPTAIVYDETPIHVIIRRLHGRLAERGDMTLDEAIEPGMHKSAVIGVFLAALELSRHHGVMIEQTGDDLAIVLRPGPTFDIVLETISSDFEPTAKPVP